ncbi:hypothetical protein [Actinorugispora endophytica]|uniref:Uncharacterized protein n=1 Tax=Actinorugispora endophytica TaxID=1605990 RepID=A0A4R6V8S8_9ACTN|nr:hypothetical protein [Actinorugispora endophytica]TDQ55559.1 hypothetical protein EV190_101891 [Actinorugispora endophytica]
MNNKAASAPAPHRTDHLVAAAAWVETPLQLLSVLEAHHTGGFARHTRVLPRSGSGALDATVAAVTAAGLPDGVDVLPSGTTPTLYRENTDTWFVGDAFSGQVQRALLRGGVREYVVVDDGLATVHLLRLLTRRVAVPLERARVRSTPARLALGLATAVRLRAAARAGRLTVFTVLPLPDGLRRDAAAVGIRVVEHDFAWLRALPGAAAPAENRVVLGSAMVRDGLLHAGPYLDWVLGHASDEPVVYYPHRREDARTLEPLNADPRIRVASHGLPAELGLRGLRDRHRVVSLPSTAVTSLRVLLGRHGVAVEAAEVPESWWTGQAAPGLRAHLSIFVTDEKDSR